jgi:putative restriction endonuclease
MPAYRPTALVDAILDAIQQSGSVGVLTTPLREHPRKFVITSQDGDSEEVWIYAWTLTPGGRPSLVNEYRIQMTSVASPLLLNQNGPTVLIGYEPNSRMFAGFDVGRHRTFTAGSPSVQIDVVAVRDALQHGLTFDRKDNAEIAVGIRPDQFVSYIRNATDLHRYGATSAVFTLLNRASQLQPVTARQLAALPAQRRRIVQIVARLSRAANFRQQVLDAYGHRCCVTRAQLKLVEAAHVMPVGAAGSADHVTNGLALSPTYHRAFDNGLIYLTDNLEMKVNPRKQSELQAAQLDGGIARFVTSLGTGRIYLPQNRNQWPDVSFVKQARKLRGI